MIYKLIIQAFFPPDKRINKKSLTLSEYVFRQMIPAASESNTLLIWCE